MQYIEFGKDKDKVSEIVMGLMRISEMSTGEVLDLIETGLEEGINFLACCAGWWLSMWERDRLSWSIPRLSSPTAARPARKDA